MQKCTKCGKSIPEGALFCGHCGAKTGFKPNHPQAKPFTEYQVQAHDGNVQYSVPDKIKVRPNCDLSVSGFVLSIFNPLMCLVAFILSAVALGKKQTRRGLAIAGLIISLIEILLVAGSYVLIFVYHIDITEYVPWLTTVMASLA